MKALYEAALSTLKMPITILFLALGLIGVVYYFMPSLESIETFIGMDTKENLKHQLDQAHANNSVLEDANKGNKAAANIAEAAGSNAEAATQMKAKTEVKDTKVVDKIKKETENKIHVIEQSNATEEEKSEQISFERIDSIWKTYCSFNKDDQCPVTMPYTPIELTSTEGEIK